MAFRLWFVRAHGPVLCLVFTALTLAIVLSSTPGWQWQSLWAASRATGSTIVVAPVLAGVIAFVVQRRLTGAARLLSASSRKGVAGALALAAVPWSAALVGLGAGMTFVAVRTASVVGSFDVPVWVLVHGLVALTAASLFGLAVGVCVPNLAAGPLAASLAYVLPILLLPFGVEGLMAAPGATGPAFGMEPDPTVHSAMIVVNVAVGALCAVIAVGRLGPVRRRWWYGAGALGVAVVIAGGTLSTMDPRMAWLRPVADDPVCVGADTQVCGPPDSAALLRIAEADIADARAFLAERGLPTTGRYSFTPRPGTADSEVGVLHAEPFAVLDGRLGSWDVAATIATPSACPEYFEDMPPEDLLVAQARLASWVSDARAGRGALVDDDVLQTYDALDACDASALPDWAYGE
ncbi:hypothetical protein [Cellulosimicrobium marinum]|uniref:hypothetical protein n=1 Tax=Cellulosimicrobium marinum TaxID=1638992 RepID=UPI001E6065E3|nr:hypothetical protein [Cellulosimicrobium marinum]MCB7136695.1 hypothetical protein [Cellulosimicrobium marinum]